MSEVTGLPDQPPPYDYMLDQPPRRARLPKRVLAAAGVVLATGAGVWHLTGNEDFNTSTAAPAGVQPVRESLVVWSQNAHHDACRQINRYAETIYNRNIDVAMFQEMTGDDYDCLKSVLPSWDVTYKGDPAQRVLQHGMGVVLASRFKQTDITAYSFSGTTLGQSIAGMAKGFMHDMKQNSRPRSIVAGDMTIQKTAEGRQETRNAIAATVEVRAYGQSPKIRVIAGHIGSVIPSIKARQYKDFKNVIAKNERGNMAVVVGADWNIEQQEIVPDLANQGFITPQTGPSADDNPGTPQYDPRPIDAVSFHPGTVFTVGHTTLINDVESDHMGLVSRINIRIPAAMLP